MKQLLMCFMLLVSGASYATDISKLNPIETIEILPKGFNDPIKYNITLPQNYTSDTDKEYFVLFDLHPRSQPFISGMQDWLSHNGEWPWLKTIVVNPASYHPEFAAVFKAWAENPNDQQVLDILQNGVLKQLDEKYRTNGFRIYSGFMGNGALGLYTLLNRPELFNAYLIASPTLGNNMGNVVNDAPEKLAAKYPGNRFLYMTIGNHGYERAHVESFKQFEKSLAKLPKGQLDWVSKSDDTHYYMSRPIVTLLNGIEALFDDIHNDLPGDSEVSQQGVDAIINYYEALSKEKYGFAISAEGSLKNLAREVAKKSPEDAIAIYQKTTALYPDSAYAYASLAKAYADQGDLEKAISIQKTALLKSQTMNKWHQNKHQEYLMQFEAMHKNTNMPEKL